MGINLIKAKPIGVWTAAKKLWPVIKKNSPRICLISGIGLGIGAVVMSGVQTWKHKDKIKEDFSKISEARAIEEHGKERNLRIASNGFELVKDTVKAYAVPASMTAAFIFLIHKGGTIYQKRIAALTVACTAMAKELDFLRQYRQNVIDTLGKEKDEELIYGAKLIEAVNPETGEVEKHALIDQGRNISKYAFYWAPAEYDADGNLLWTNPLWTGDKITDLATILSIESTVCHLIRAKGFMSVNDILVNYFHRLPVDGGWNDGFVYHGKNGDDSEQDNFISFGVRADQYQFKINQLFTDPNNDFNTPLIDFNYDGDISYVYKDPYEYSTASEAYFKKRGRKVKETEQLGCCP